MPLPAGKQFVVQNFQGYEQVFTVLSSGTTNCHGNGDSVQSSFSHGTFDAGVFRTLVTTQYNSYSVSGSDSQFQYAMYSTLKSFVSNCRTQWGEHSLVKPSNQRTSRFAIVCCLALHSCRRLSTRSDTTYSGNRRIQRQLSRPHQPRPTMAVINQQAHQRRRLHLPLQARNRLERLSVRVVRVLAQVPRALRPRLHHQR